MLKKNYVRDGKNRIIASITSGYSDTSSVVRDENNQIAGAPVKGFKPPETRMEAWFPSIHMIPVC